MFRIVLYSYRLTSYSSIEYYAVSLLLSDGELHEIRRQHVWWEYRHQTKWENFYD